MGFDFGAIGTLFSNPVVIVLFVAICVLIVFGFGYFIVRNIRGGFGRFTRPKDVFQRCVCITPSNNLLFYKLRVQDEYVDDEKNCGSHFLYSDALIPDKKTGHMWLPVDTQQSTPLYPFDTDLQKKRNKHAADHVSYIAAKEDSRAITLAQSEAFKGQGMEMQKFALVSSLAVLLLIVIVVLVTKML